MHLVFPHRIARLSYFARNVVIAALSAVIALLIGTDGAAALVAALLLALYCGAFVVAPRCRDSGLSPWSAFLLLVPEVNLFLGGYLTWKRSWPTTDGLDLSLGIPTSAGPGNDPATVSGERTALLDSLRRLEALRDEGAITEQDFVRRKARLEKKG